GGGERRRGLAAPAQGGARARWLPLPGVSEREELDGAPRAVALPWRSDGAGEPRHVVRALPRSGARWVAADRAWGGRRASVRRPAGACAGRGVRGVRAAIRLACAMAHA